MLNFIKKYYIQLITIFVFFVAIIIMIQITFSAMNMIRNKSEELIQAQLDYVLAGEFLNNVYKFKQNILYIRKEAEWTDVLLPNDDDEKVFLFSSLERLADETGNESINLKVKTVDPKKVTKAVKTAAKGDTGKEIKPLLGDNINLEITLVGNYNDLIYFLKKIENMQYFSEVLSLNIVKQKIAVVTDANEEQREDLLTTTMNVVFYLNNK